MWKWSRRLNVWFCRRLSKQGKLSPPQKPWTVGDLASDAVPAAGSWQPVARAAVTAVAEAGSWDQLTWKSPGAPVAQAHRCFALRPTRLGKCYTLGPTVRERAYWLCSVHNCNCTLVASGRARSVHVRLPILSTQAVPFTHKLYHTFSLNPYFKVTRPC